MRNFLLLIFLISACTPRPVLAQIFDDFHDQSLFQGLIWGGDIGAFQTNTNRQLQLNASSPGVSNIYFQNGLNNANNWELQFWLRLNFNPSSLNFCRLYLQADQSDLMNAANALYLEFGEAGSQDAPKLFCRQNGNDSLLAVGPAGSVAAAFQLFFKCKYQNGLFTLESHASPAAASNLWLSGQVPLLPTCPFAGLACVYTTSNVQGFYLDDLYVGELLNTNSTELIFTEIMADPDPQLGLPNTEYIEIYNAGASLIQLNGYQLSDATSSCTLPSFWLQPGNYATLVGTGQSSGFIPMKTIEVPAFISFNNTGETLTLKNPQGEFQDQVAYHLNWYKDSSKMDGGYSLERCSLEDPCSAADNWRGSEAPIGGTPCLPNSVIDDQPDTTTALLLYAEVRDSNQIAFVFSEPMDSLSLAQANLAFSENLGPYATFIFSVHQLQMGAQMILLFENSLPNSLPINISLTSVADCWANQSSYQTVALRAEEPQLGDLLINEILFDPPANGADFIEIYNISNKFISLSNCTISNHAVSYSLPKHVMKPHSFLALCPDTAFLIAYYPQAEIQNLRTQQLPYFYNDSGTCILRSESLILDQLNYKSAWHSPLVLDPEGVSLERLNATASTQSAQNWFSAAQSAGFATPGVVNSQQLAAKQNGQLYLSHPELSPDQDGYHDFLEIQYQLPAPNMLVQADIFTLSGQLVKHLTNNELFGTEGVLIWDGSTEYGAIASSGIYILDFVAFSTDQSVFFNRRLSFARCIKR
jgi:hypothetical protein